MSIQNVINQTPKNLVEFSIPAGAWAAAGTDGAEAGQTVYSGNDLDHFAFDASTEEAVYTQFRYPADMNPSDPTFRWSVDWDAVATASGTAVWGLSGKAFANDEALNTALGTERTVTDTLLAVGDRHQSPNDATGITIAGAPNPGELVLLKLVLKTSGTISVDCLFLNLQIQYTTWDATPPTIWT